MGINARSLCNCGGHCFIKVDARWVCAHCFKVDAQHIPARPVVMFADYKNMVDLRAKIPRGVDVIPTADEARAALMYARGNATSAPTTNGK